MKNSGYSRWHECVILMLLSIGLLFLGTSVVCANADKNQEFVKPVQQDDLWLTVPFAIQHLINEETIARVAIRIDESGKVVDWIPLDLPHYKLLSSIGISMKYLEFSPALLGGNPITVDMVLEIPVGEVGYYGVFPMSVATYLESRVASLVPDLHQLVVSPIDKVDVQLEILSKGKIYVPVDPGGNRMQGEVDVEFYVDPNGTAHLASSDDSLDPVLRQAAHLTVQQIKFNKPTRSGNPTVVKAKMAVKY